MERALIIGATGGIGAAVAEALRARGAQVTALSRSADGLDLTDPASVEAVMGGLSGPYDLIFVATGGLEIDGRGPEKALREIDAGAMRSQFELNTIGPALVLRHAARLLPRKGPSHFAALSARVGSIGDNRLGGWYSYRAAKAALNQIMHTAAIEIARTHREACVVALHPGTVATPLTADYARGHPTVPPDEAARNLLGVLARLGHGQSGGFYDWRGDEVVW